LEAETEVGLADLVEKAEIKVVLLDRVAIASVLNAVKKFLTSKVLNALL